MQWSTDIRQMKAALWDQAFIGGTHVSCPDTSPYEAQIRVSSPHGQKDCGEVW